MTTEIEEKVAQLGDSVRKLQDELARVIVGQESVIEDVLLVMISGGHTLLEWVPGLGKTRLVRALAGALDLSFSRLQFTPDLMPSDITGTRVAVQDERGQTVLDFQRGPIFANVILADEVNRATPRTQSAMLEAMQERSVTIAGTTHILEEPFFVLATQNPLEMDGTYPLPEAQLDRFLFKLHVDHPSAQELHQILERTTGWEEPSIERVLGREDLMELRKIALDVPVAPHVRDYVVRLVQATHPGRPEAPEEVTRYVRYGASPRGAQAMERTAKVRAVLRGRFAVAPDDVRAVALPALRHRLIRSFEGEAEGISTDRIITTLLNHVSEESP